MVVRLSAQDLSGSESMRNLLRFSPHTSIITSEGMSLNVSTSLLSMYSSMLPSILSLHPCVSSTILLPDFTLLTLSNLIELLTKGYSKQCTDDLEVQSMLDIGEALGMDLDSLYLGSKKDSTSLFHVKEEYNNEEIAMDSSGEIDKFSAKAFPHNIDRADNLGGKIKEIVRKRETVESENGDEELMLNSSSKDSSYLQSAGYIEELTKLISQESENSQVEITSIENLEEVITENPEINLKCQVCSKVCLSFSLLGYHYCKHFSKDISKLDLTGIMEDNSCLKCKQKFYDRSTLLSHIGVKHEYVNIILQVKGITVLPLSQLKRKRAAAKAKKEQDGSCADPKADVPTSTSLLRESETNSSLYDLLPGNVKHLKKNDNLVIIDNAVKNELFKELEALKTETSQKDKIYTETNLDLKNEGIKCPLCPNQYTIVSKLKQHLCRHFREELKSACVDIIQGTTCGLCNEMFKLRSAVWVHIGTRHGKLDEILEIKGLPKLVNTGRPTKIKETSINFASENDANLSENEAVENDISAPLYDGCTCLVCGKVFANEEKTIEHVEFRHGRLKEEFEESNKTKKLLINKSAEVNFVTNCEVCHKEFDALSRLSQHMVRIHFWKEVKETFKHLYDGSTCLICYKSFPKQKGTVLHIGSMHRKIDLIMAEKGLKPLKNETVLKKVKAEVDETEDNICDEVQNEDNLEVSTDDKLLESKK